MSILLHGKVQTADSSQEAGSPKEGCTWRGKWRFVKEKKEQDFEYRRVSDEIPMDLIRHVSFISTGNHLENLRERLKKKKKRRGRFTSTKMNSEPYDLPIPDGIPQSASYQFENSNDSSYFPNPLSADMSGHSATTVSADMTVSAEVTQSENNQEDVSNPDFDEKTDNDGTFDVDKSPMNSISEAPVTPLENTDSQPPYPSTFKLECKDPLFGLWSGAFKVEASNGSEPSPVPVEETFFLYGYAGTQVQDLPEELHILPPEQYFSIPLLLDVKIKDPKLNTKSHSVQQPMTNLQEDVTKTTGAVDEDINGTHPVTTHSQDLVTSTIVKNGDTIKTPDSVRTSIAESMPPTELNDVNVKSECTPRLSFAEDAYASMKFILGFGKNVYGRYSLICYFDQEANTLRCEKRYMLTRQGNCRKTKSKTPSSSSAVQYQEEHQNGKRKRIPKPRYFPGATDDDFLMSISNTSNEEEVKKPKIAKPMVFTISDDKNFREAFFDPNTGEIYEGGMKILVWLTSLTVPRFHRINSSRQRGMRLRRRNHVSLQ